MAEKAEIVERLKSRIWRLNNLYWIRPKEGQKLIPFRMNWAQAEVWRNLHYANLVLKCRQIGLTTLFCIIFLDDCLFSEQRETGIVADTENNAQSIFRTKVKLVWENFAMDWPCVREMVRSSVKLLSDQGKQLIFSNGSSIRVATTMRSGTLSSVLITEYGKISAKDPDKAEEIMSGTLEAVPMGGLKVIESTAYAPVGDFYRKCLAAEKLLVSVAKLSSMDFKFHFFPWQMAPEYRLDETVVPDKETNDYLDEVEAKLGIKIDAQQRAWYQKKKEALNDKIKREYPSNPAEAFEAAVEGSYYAKWMRKAEDEKRIGFVPHEPALSVYTAWDLGTSADAMAIGFFQVFRREIRIIDFYQGGEEGFPFYVNLLRSKPYNYAEHFAPHDIAVKDMGSGKSRLEVARELKLEFTTVKNIPIIDGIDAVRNIFPRLFIDRGKCGGDDSQAVRLIEALWYYHKEFSEKKKMFLSNPEKDWSNHACDMLRYFAVGFEEEAENAVNKPPPMGLTHGGTAMAY